MIIWYYVSDVYGDLQITETAHHSANQEPTLVAH